MALGLYVHIPFCSAICNYCNFNRGLFDADLKTQYVAALQQEIRGRSEGVAADTIFFGGGTPSLLEPHEIAGDYRDVPRRVRASPPTPRSRSKPIPKRSPPRSCPAFARLASIV